MIITSKYLKEDCKLQINDKYNQSRIYYSVKEGHLDLDKLRENNLVDKFYRTCIFI